MVVDLGISSCMCNMSSMTGIPCEHAVACMAYKNVDPEDFVHPFFFVQLWRKTYEPYVRPINLSEFWHKTGLPDIDPPPFKRPAGRPKK
ncbi:WAS/WASL-interacting protein family member 1-like [Senna tora]|uniref:WAS/WASL-interacting protein family member 1-like n=1 Tax=Senna tora TaxID=362788 RepID=A0A834TZC4_9FABA|nr:WAS/WASL-interacting protein family member 1-like [Senna tora]